MLEAVDKVVPVDDLTLDLETSIPQPALLKCFIPALVPVLPAHIYGDGTPIDTHPANLRAVGPARSALPRWKKGKPSSSNVTKAFSSPASRASTGSPSASIGTKNEIPLLRSCRARPISLRLLSLFG